MSTPLDTPKSLTGLPIPSATQVQSLSFAQETMLFWDKLVPRSAVYNVPIAFRIDGNLDQRALLESLRTIISRHQVLRSSYFFHRGEPAVALRSSTEPNLLALSLSTGSGQSEAQHAADNEARRPFDLANEPLLRASLIRLRHAEYILVLAMHHIAADGWSLGILLSELAESYRAHLQNEPPNLPVLRAQYPDFARWQRSFLQRSDSLSSVDFWKQQLHALSHECDPLPLDHPRQATQTFEGFTIRTTLPASFLAELAHIGQLRRATPFMVMLAVLQVLLRMHSRSDDICIGVPNANRIRPEFEDLIGCFVNMVAVRTNLAGIPNFLELLARVREVALGAFLHSELPFSEVVRQLRPKRTANRTPFFQVQLVFQSYPMPRVQWPGLELERMNIETATSKFDLSVLVEMKDHGLEIAFEFNRNLFEHHSMHRLLQDYKEMLLRVVKAPETRLQDLSAHALVC